VVMKYRGTLDDGSKFDAGSGFCFTIDGGEVRRTPSPPRSAWCTSLGAYEGAGVAGCCRPVARRSSRAGTSA
jgi:hypothetical protein